jgi:hypothetical protein
MLDLKLSIERLTFEELLSYQAIDFAMKVQTGLCATMLALLALPGLVSGDFIVKAIPAKSSAIAPANSPLTTPTSKDHWDLELYRDKKCTGTAIHLKGNGSSDCHTDLPNKGTKSFNARTLDPNCEVTLYKDSKCSHKNKIANIFANKKNTCATARWTNKVKGYKVKCL